MIEQIMSRRWRTSFRADADFAMAMCGGTIMTAADGRVRPVNRPYVTSPVTNDNEPGAPA